MSTAASNPCRRGQRSEQRINAYEYKGHAFVVIALNSQQEGGNSATWARRVLARRGRSGKIDDLHSWIRGGLAEDSESADCTKCSESAKHQRHWARASEDTSREMSAARYARRVLNVKSEGVSAQALQTGFCTVTRILVT